MTWISAPFDTYYIAILDSYMLYLRIAEYRLRDYAVVM